MAGPVLPAILSAVLATAAQDPPNAPVLDPETVVAKYTFDGRVPAGSVVKRTHSAVLPYGGEAYVPNGRQGETGPVLRNPGGGGESRSYYRSFFNNASGEAADGRQVLDLRLHQVFHLDTYQTPADAEALPADGSFTWELVARIDQFDGVNHFGMILDASRGAGRIGNYPGKGNNKAITTRLWMRPVKENPDAFVLCFSVPVNDENRVVTVETEIMRKRWYHLAAVYDDKGHEARLYVDGELMASKPVESCGNRSTSFGLAGAFSPDVFRVDHRLRLQAALFDAIAMTRDARTPETFVLSHRSAY